MVLTMRPRCSLILASATSRRSSFSAPSVPSSSELDSPPVTRVRAHARGHQLGEHFGTALPAPAVVAAPRCVGSRLKGPNEIARSAALAVRSTRRALAQHLRKNDRPVRGTGARGRGERLTGSL